MSEVRQIKNYFNMSIIFALISHVVALLVALLVTTIAITESSCCQQHRPFSSASNKYEMQIDTVYVIPNSIPILKNSGQLT